MALPSAPLGDKKEADTDEPQLKARAGVLPKMPVQDDAELRILRDQRKAADAENSDHMYEITAEDLIHNPPEEYSKFDGKVVDIIGYLQEEMQANGMSELVAQARTMRGKYLEEAKPQIHNLALGYIINKNLATGHDSEVLASLVVNEITGLGPIEPLWQNPDITEIMVNGYNKVRIEIGGKLQTARGARFRDEEHLLETCRSILAPIGRTIDVAHPYEDGRLPDGSRVNITHSSIGNLHNYLTIRRFRAEAFSMEDLVNFGSMTPDLAEFLGNMIHHGLSTIIAGPTGAGKTSLLNALSGCIPDEERVITIEDNIEMTLNPRKDVVALEARKAAQGDKGSVTIRDLVKNALRMRPDRIIVGEVRDGSAYDMLQAMNTGHDGSMTTVHANDPYGAIDRIMNLISEVGEVDSNRALSLVAGGVDIIVSIDRYEDGSRRLASIAEIPYRVETENGANKLEPRILWEFQQTGSSEEGKVFGEYVKINELSEQIVKRKRLDNKPKVSLEEIYKISSHTN